MYYRFPLRQIYRADSNEKVWCFRARTQRDLRAVSRWIRRAANLTFAHGRDIHKALLQEFRATAAVSHHQNWMVTIRGKRIFWLQVGESGSPDTIEIFLIGHPTPLKDRRAALILWRRAINFLRSLGLWSTFIVKLSASRDMEAAALEKLGFTRVGDYYVTLPPEAHSAPGEQENEDGE